MRRISSHIALCLLLLLGIPYVKGQQCLPALGARGAAMGGVQVALDDGWSLAQTGAGSAWIPSAWGAMSYRQNYLMPELSHGALALMVPIGKQSALSGQYVHWGNLDYNEQYVTIGYALKVAPRVALAAQFHYLYAGTADAYYDSEHLVTASLSVQVRPSDEWVLGAHCFNPLMIRYSHSDFRVPARLTLGASYRALPQLLLVAEAEKVVYAPLSLRLGLEYAYRSLSFRGGISTAPTLFALGMGWHYRQLHVDFGVQCHQLLGFTPAITISKSF